MSTTAAIHPYTRRSLRSADYRAALEQIRARLDDTIDQITAAQRAAAPSRAIDIINDISASAAAVRCAAERLVHNFEQGYYED